MRRGDPSTLARMTCFDGGILGGIIPSILSVNKDPIVPHLSKPLTVALLFASFTSLVGCANLRNEGVQGAYPVKTPKAIKGALLGGTAGAAAGGLSTNPHAVAIGAAAGAMAGSTYGHNEATINGLSKTLREQGINVVFLGEYVELVLPVDIFFEPNDPQLKIKSYGILDDVTFLLKALGSSQQLTITGFTDNVDLLDHKLQLSTLQSQSIATYLWTHGIKKERMQVYGGADSATIANPNTIHGNAYNRRVEITLRRNNIHQTPMNRVVA